MGKRLDSITAELEKFIASQPLFFVATAPLARDGHVNVSPKGLDTFRVLASDRVAYLDLTGSGNETTAHLAENSRITVLFCTFSGPPKILRLYGTGEAVLPASARWGELRPLFPEIPGARQVVEITVTRIQISCGFGVPRLDLLSQRDTLPKWAEAKGPEGLSDYWREKNATSIDGLPTPLGYEGDLPPNHHWSGRRRRAAQFIHVRRQWFNQNTEERP